MSDLAISAGKRIGRARRRSKFVVDNVSGMRDLVTHLVRDHEYRRIAFIRGAANNVESEGRYLAYRDFFGSMGSKFTRT